MSLSTFDVGEAIVRMRARRPFVVPFLHSLPQPFDCELDRRGHHVEQRDAMRLTSQPRPQEPVALSLLRNSVAL
jgi:hypothetical protein